MRRASRTAAPAASRITFARGKLRVDPVYRDHPRARVCCSDERACWIWVAAKGFWPRGCGLRSDATSIGSWPRAWPPAPRALSTRGIELMARDVARARRCAWAVMRDIAGRHPQHRFRHSRCRGHSGCAALHEPAGPTRGAAARTRRAAAARPVAAARRRCRRRLAISLRPMERQARDAVPRACRCGCSIAAASRNGASCCANAASTARRDR